MWQRFTERARNTVFYAQAEALRLGKTSVGPEHLLLGLLRVSGSIANRLIVSTGQISSEIQAELLTKLPVGSATGQQDLELLPLSKMVIDFAFMEAKSLNNNYIGTEHLLLGLLRLEEGVAYETLTRKGILYPDIVQRTIKVQNGLNPSSVIHMENLAVFSLIDIKAALDEAKWIYGARETVGTDANVPPSDLVLRTLRDKLSSAVQQLTQLRLTELNLSSRIIRVLEVANIQFICQLIQYTPKELLSIRGVGPEILRAVQVALNEHNLDLLT